MPRSLRVLVFERYDDAHAWPSSGLPAAERHRRLRRTKAAATARRDMARDPPAATRKLPQGEEPRAPDGRNRPHQRPRPDRLPTIPSRERQHPGSRRRQPYQRARGHDRGLPAPSPGAGGPCRPGPAADRRGGSQRPSCGMPEAEALTEDTPPRRTRAPAPARRAAIAPAPTRSCSRPRPRRSPARS